ncbi:hypothetical protein [Legionella spiritensis]|uniref:Outer membrane protein beta-barrel domain-containing protein n=1 Tax=Legionella spiritensis TaxID=452 RepID=A0A0W0Z5D6_LEGSP|nr:hypothetical protein [Legionella spiritensis]KTD64360.1 hypothetical protein Lspi_1167 [Legionella spiritensis]SNV46329.1 Uncharacterised protein [Legionella spiritensis]
MKKLFQLTMGACLLVNAVSYADTLSPVDKFGQPEPSPHHFWIGIRSIYAYEDNLKTTGSTARNLVDVNTWTNMLMAGWAPRPFLMPYAGIGAFKIRTVDSVQPSENTVSPTVAQGNVITKPDVAGIVGIKGIFSRNPESPVFLGYDVNYFISNPQISYAVIRGSIGINQSINLKYHTFNADIIAGYRFEDGFLYAGPSFMRTKGTYSKPAIGLSSNNTYFLRSIEQQQVVGLVTGVRVSPKQTWNIDLKTRFINKYSVELEISHAI